MNPTWQTDDGGVKLHIGDCLDILPTLEPGSVDAVVTDPPYNLGFMGKSWDKSGVAFQPETWAAMLRVAKPGAHLLAFGGTRTFHRMTCAIEDAGWEIRDCLMWVYGSGFPKSLNLAVAFDKQTGMAARGVGFTTAGYTPSATVPGGAHPAHKPTSELGKQWQGWGTALKPAWEPIILARKPIEGTVAANVLKHGTGALNIDGCRIHTGEKAGGSHAPCLQFGGQNTRPYQEDYVAEPAQPSMEGRWPANLLLDEDAAAQLDEQTGTLTSGSNNVRTKPGDGYHGGMGKAGDVQVSYGDSGGASRFFYCAKVSRAEREAGLEGETHKVISVLGGDEDDLSEGHKATRPFANNHPTIKPLDLMGYLCRLITPPGGLVLDPMMGSGSTGIAAIQEGFRFVGIELDPNYFAIAVKRIKAELGRFPLLEENTALYQADLCLIG